MSSSARITTTQQFEIERLNRAIDATVDPQQLQVMAQQLLQAWQSQRAATEWVLRQQSGNHN